MWHGNFPAGVSLQERAMGYFPVSWAGEIWVLLNALVGVLPMFNKNEQSCWGKILPEGKEAT